MSAGSRLAALAALIALLAAAPASAAKVVKYEGETEEGRKVKLVAKPSGAVIRGAITTETVCDRGFDPFRARVELHSPLDRSGPKGFRDRGSRLEEDDRFSGRYRHKVEAERVGEDLFRGVLDLEIVFRRDGEEYTRCLAEDVAWKARRAR